MFLIGLVIGLYIGVMIMVWVFYPRKDKKAKKYENIFRKNFNS